jgi:hypothetical protein
VRARDGGDLLVETALGMLAVPADAEAGRTVSLSLRPEHLGLGPAPAGALPLPSTTIEEVVFQGTHLRVRGRTESGVELLLRLPAGASVAQGMRAPLHADPARIVLLVS